MEPCITTLAARLQRLAGKVESLELRVQEAGRLIEPMAEHTEPPFTARDLLAVIHRDGGKHTSEVGFAQSIADATEVLAARQAEIGRLRAVADELLSQRGRLEQMEADYHPGLPERRLADDLLDAIQQYEAAEAAGGNDVRQ